MCHPLELPADQFSDLIAVKRRQACQAGQEFVLVYASGLVPFRGRGRLPRAVLGTRCQYRSTVVVMELWPSCRETSAMGPPWPMLHWLLEGTGCRIRARCVSA